MLYLLGLTISRGGEITWKVCGGGEGGGWETAGLSYYKKHMT